MARINKIKSIIWLVSSQGKISSYKKLVAEFCLSEGLAKRTVMEYLDLLVDSGQVRRNGDELQPVDKDLEILETERFI